MSPINLTDTNDPHHSLLYKPKKVSEAVEKDIKTEPDESPSFYKEEELAAKNKVYWWGKPRN